MAAVATPPPARDPTANPQYLFVDGSFNDLAREMADYVHVGDEVRQLLEIEQKEEVITKLAGASHMLNTVPEKEFTSASNLMIHLVLQSADPKKYLPTLCTNFSRPLSASHVHGPGLALNALTTVFNLLEPASPIRARVFMEIVKFFKQHAMFDALKPYLEKLPAWLESWQTPLPFQRELYEEISATAVEAGEEEESYQYTLRALRTFDSEEAGSEKAQMLSLQAVRTALQSHSHYQFQDLRAVPSVQALAESHPTWSELLNILAKRDLEDYKDFKDEYEGFVENEKLDDEKLTRKMRLLTFASLAAATPSRELEYARIAHALQVPVEDVEMWAIDVIRAGLVEGKLSQQRRVFLVHRATYRVFGEKQYRELSTRIDQWRSTLQNVLMVLRQEQENARVYKGREVHEFDKTLAGANMNDGGGQNRHHHNRDHHYGDRGARRQQRGGYHHGGQQQQQQSAQPQPQQQKEKEDNDD